MSFQLIPIDHFLTLKIVLTGFTDGYGYGSAHLDSLKGSFRKTAVLLRSWSGESVLLTSPAVATHRCLITGLMHCCMHDNRGIKSLVESLRVPVVEMRVSLRTSKQSESQTAER